MDVVRREMMKLVNNEKPLSKTTFLDYARKSLGCQKRDVAVALDLLVQDGYLTCERMENAEPGQQSTKFVRRLKPWPTEDLDEEYDDD